LRNYSEVHPQTKEISSTIVDRNSVIHRTARGDYADSQVKISLTPNFNNIQMIYLCISREMSYFALEEGICKNR